MALTDPYYKDELLTIYHGDCLQLLAYLDPVDVIITDPPFFLPPKQTGARGSVWNGSIGDFWLLEQAFRPVLSLFKEKIKPTGQLYIHCHERSYPVFYRLAYSLWPRLHLIVWYKPTGRIGHGWRHSHELILHLASENAEYTDGFRADVIGIMPVRSMKRGHPAEKPGELTDFLLEAVPNNAKTFLDPFAGSGSSLFAAMRRGMQATGIEIDEQYCQEIVKRRKSDIRTYSE